MFSLRDLILSQSQSIVENVTNLRNDRNSQSDTENVTFDAHKAFSSPITQNENRSYKDDLSDTDYDEFDEILHVDKQSKIWKENVSMKNDKRNPLMCQEPEYLHFHGKPHSMYAPGLNTHLKYPTERILLRDQKELLNYIWRECYFAEDYQGAIMTLYHMIDVQAIEFEDLYMAVDILRRADDYGQLLQQLIQSVGYFKFEHKSLSKRKALLGLFADAFSSRDDISRVKALFQSRSVDPAYNDSAVFLAYNIIIICYESITLAESLVEISKSDDDSSEESIKINFSNSKKSLSKSIIECNLTGIVTLPSTIDLLRDLFEFEKFIQLLYNQTLSIDSIVSTERLNHNKMLELKRLSQSCQKNLKELKLSFQSGLKLNSFIDGNMDLHILYMAYLRGINQRERATDHMNTIVKTYRKLIKAPNKHTHHRIPVDSIIPRYQSFYRIGMTYFSKYQKQTEDEKISNDNDNRDESDESIDEIPLDSLSRVVKLANHWIASTTMIVEHIENYDSTVFGPVHPEMVMIGDIMYRLRKISRYSLIKLVCKAIESSPTDAVCPYSNGLNQAENNHSEPQYNRTLMPIDQGTYQSYLWRLLCDNIGPLPSQRTIHDPIDRNSEVYRLINQSNGPDISEELQRRILSGQYELSGDVFAVDLNTDSDLNDEIHVVDDIPDPEDKIQGILSNISWWTSSILSPFPLGELNHSILESIHLNCDNLRSDVGASLHCVDDKLFNDKFLTDTFQSICAYGYYHQRNKDAINIIMYESSSYRLLHEIETNSETNEKKKSLGPFDVRDEMLHHPSPHLPSQRITLLGYGIIYNLSKMIIMDTRLCSQDSLFTIIAIQRLLENYHAYRNLNDSRMSDAILDLLESLSHAGLNFDRVLRIGLLLSLQ